MGESPDNEELAERVAALERAMRELQADLAEETVVGSGSLPSPPDASDVLQFADEAAIPAMIFVLKANIRILQVLRRAIRTADSGSGQRAEERVALVGERTLDRFDSLLIELQQAVEGASDNPAARDVLKEAKDLQSELDRRVEEASRGAEPADTEDEADSTASTIDIDEELDAIKREHGEDGDESGSVDEFDDDTPVDS